MDQNRNVEMKPIQTVPTEESKHQGMSDFGTLDEPVSETIKRDLLRIYNKLKIVINPF